MTVTTNDRSTPTEREPLLDPQPQHSRNDLHDSDARSEELDKDLKASSKQVGPLDISRKTRYGILAGIWMGSFLSALNQTLVPTMLPHISSEFNKSNQASWLGTSYLLATCTFTPLYGRLCNVLGRRGANQTALIFAGLGVLLCGLSKNLETLIFARFLAGIGGGGLFTTSTIIVGDMYTMRSRGLTQGVASVFNSLGLGLGGPLGGLITDWLGWRWAFLVQIPLFFCSYVLTSINLNYVTEGKGKSTKEILRRIDYGGSVTLMMAVGSCLLLLSAKYNEGLPWFDPFVITSALLAGIFAVAFVLVEIYVAPEPVLAPSLLKQSIPVLVGTSNFLVATCNFSIMYFYPMWFQTVMLTSASVAGMHLMPNSLAISLGSLFAGWMMHLTGRYKLMNLTLGFFPFIGATFIYRLREDSGFWVSWFSIVPLGFGNAVVLQTMLIALLVHLPDDQMAVGTGFGQLFRGVGQVGGVAISSAVFQSKLETELRKRIYGFPDAEALIIKIRQNARLVGTLPPDLRRAAQESYRVGLKSVFFFAACMTLMAYIVRLPIPDKHLDAGHPKHHHHKHQHHHRDQESQEPSDGGDTVVGAASEASDHNNSLSKKARNASTTTTDYGTLTTTTSTMTVTSQQSTLRDSNVFKEANLNLKSECNSESGESESDSEFDVEEEDGPHVAGRERRRTRRMSTYESTEGGLDPQASYSKPTM